MHTYRSFQPDLYTVGHYDPTGDWQPESYHKTEAEAAARVHYLNGGTKPDERVDDLVEQLSEDLATFQEWTRSELERLENQIANREREIEALQERCRNLEYRS